MKREAVAAPIPPAAPAEQAEKPIDLEKVTAE
jgi:hypothetical protein